MEKFNFKLERVLNYKETIENYKKNRYGMVKQKLDREESILNNFNEYKRSLIDEKNSLSANIKVGDFRIYSSYINTLNDKIKQQEEVVINTKHELEKAKSEMVEAVKEKKTFEKLKENEYEKYIYELKKQEDKLVDTLVSFKTTTQH